MSVFQKLKTQLGAAKTGPREARANNNSLDTLDDSENTMAEGGAPDSPQCWT